MIRAIIFDLDGTIIDNEEIYGRAFCSVLKKHDISCAEVKHTSGIGIRENWERMKGDLGLPGDPTDLAAQTQQFYLEHAKGIRVRPDFVETARYFRKRGLKVLLATSNTTENGKQILSALGIEKLFDTVTFGDEVARKKPAPDIFLKALETIKRHPREALVVEDSPAGIAAARSANIKVAALKTSRFNRIDLARADYLVNHLSELKDLI